MSKDMSFHRLKIKMKKNTNKVINASLGVVMAVSGAASSVAPVSVYAETVETPEKGFAITDSKTGSPVALGEDTVIKVYADSSKNKELDGAAKIEGNRIVFTPAGALDGTSEFYFSIEVPGYEEAFGGPFTFATGDVDVAIKKITPENITFTIADGTAITDNDIVFKKDGQTIQVPYTNGAFDFSSYAAGDTIEYTVNKTGYITADSSFVLENGDAAISVNTSKKPELDVTADAITKTYGDSEFNVLSDITVPDGYDGGFTYTVKEGSDVVDVKEDGTVTIKKAGTAVITMSSNETAQYNPAEKDVTITVNKKDLGTLDASMFTWPEIAKTFDGTKEFSATGSLKSGNGLVGEDKLEVAVDLESDSVDVGERATKITKADFTGNTENYSYQFSQFSGPAAKINAKELNVSLSDYSTVYGSKEWKALKKGTLLAGTDIKSLVTINGNLNEIDTKAIEKFDYEKLFAVAPDAKAYLVGTAEDKLTLSLKKATVGNYRLAIEDEKANIIVSAGDSSDADAWNKVAVDEKNSSYISKSGNTTYARPGGRIAFKTNDPDNLYDTVNIKQIAPSAAAKFSNTLEISENAASGDVQASFFLSNSGNTNTRIPDKAMPAGTIKIDAEYPELTFEDGTGKHSVTKSGETPVLNTLAFDHAVREEGYTLKVATNDAMSGVASTEYAIISVANETDANEAITAACKADTTKWTKLPESGKVKVDGTTSGYYIVLVKTSDKVGNEAVYASNGTVVDTTAPTLTINGINSAKVYGDDVHYSITIGDPADENGVYSGIESVSVVVSHDGSTVAGTNVNGTDTYKLLAKDIYGEGSDAYTFAGFDASSKETTINGVITAAKNNSNNVKIKVTVYDKSGNSYTETKTLMIDTDKPAITASYDNNDVRNGKYFNKDRKMTVSVTERNFDEKDLVVAATIDGVEGTYSIEQIRNGEVDGIYLAEDRMDSEKSGNVSTYTNARKNTYVIGFGGNGTPVDHDYKVNVSYKDAAGNSSPMDFGSSKAATEFTVDEIAPVLSMTYLNGNGTETLAGEDAANPYYDTKSVKANVNVDERNFNKKNIALAVTSKDSNGKTVDAYSQTDVEAAQTGNWKTNGNTHSYEMKDFTNDANYAVSGTYMDLAGNQAVAYAPHYFTVDKTAPTGKLYVTGSNGEKKEYSREEAKDGGILEFIFNLFDNNSVKIENEAADATSGLKSVKYCIVDVNADAAAKFTIDTKFESLDWKDWTGELKVNSDKTAVVFARLEDKAGHLTYISSDGGIIVDKKEAEAPSITVEGGSSDCYKDNFTVDVTAQDPDNGGRGIFSGMKKITYQLIDDNTGKKSKVTELVSSDTPRERKLTGKIQIDASAWDTNNLRLHVVAEDFAGNTVEKDETYSVDATAPVVTTSMDTSDVKNGKYYNTTKTIITEFQERNYDDAKAFMKVTVDGVEKTYSMKQLLDGEGAKDGIIITSVGDTQKDLAENKRTDDRKVAYSVAVGNEADADHIYKDVSFECKDCAGNNGSASLGKEIVVDKIAPVMHITYSNGSDITKYVTTNANSPYFGNRDIVATISVDEKHFAESGLDLKLSQKNNAGEDVSAYKGSLSPTGWDSNGNKHTVSMQTFSGDAVYGLSGEFTDLAGNKAVVYDAHYFCVDKTAPTGKLYVTGSNGEKREYSHEEAKDGGALEFIFNLFDNNSVKIENEAADATSGLKSVKYCIVDANADAAAKFTIDTDFESLDWKDWTGELKVNSDKIAVVFARLEDKAGNLTYVSSDGGIIVDKKEAEAPSITVEGGSLDYYKDNFTVNVTAKDPDNGGRGIFSGMKKITYQLIDDNTGKKSKVTELVSSDTPRKRELTGKIKIDTKTWNTNNLRLHVVAEDFAGNTVEKDKTYKVDATAPVVTTSMDTSDVKNGKYYNTTKTITAKFQERNYDDAKAFMKITVDGTKRVYSMKQLLDGEGAKDGIIITSVDDTQKDLAENKRTDDRKVTYQVAVGNETDADHIYKDVSFECKDYAGNEGSASLGKEIVIDKIAPVMHITYSDGSDITKYVTTNANSPYFGNRDIVATISVDEKHFAESGLDLKLSQKNNAGEDVSAYKGSLSPKGWESNGNKHTVSMQTFSGDAIYGLSGEFTDLAGNKAIVYDTHYFCVDKTAPEGSVTINTKTGAITSTELHENVQFGVIEGNSVDVSRAAYDATSGVASIQYYKYVPDTEARGTFKALTKAQLASLDWKDWSGNLSVAPDSQAVLYAKITDKAGNITYINSKGGIIADKTNPSAPEINIDAKASKGVFKGDVPVSFSVEDVLNGGTYAGLKTVKVQVLKNGEVTQEKDYDYSPKEDRKHSMDGSITVDAGKNNSNNVVIRVTAVDYAGNQSSSEKKIAIDITAPRIEVIYDNNSPSNGKYYNNVRTATVKVYERNFDPDGIAMNITGTNGAKPTISGWSVGNKAGVSDDNVNICTITYSADADYTFTMSATDLAGNKTNYEKTDEFVIDRTKPVISVGFDNNNGKGKYYNASRTATITVKEHNFDAKGFTSAIKAYLEGKGIAAPSVSGWSNNGDTHTATIRFANDGDYSFILDFVDLAGNKAETYTQGEFTIDLTKPKITFGGVGDKSANRGDVAPTVTFSDVNFQKDSVSVTLAGLKHAKKNVTGSFTASANGGTVTLSDFKHVQSEDDIYTLTATTTDAAGNVTTESITFSVNRFGSNYYFSKDSEKFLNSRYHKKGQDITIYEVNVDELKEHGITVNHNGTATKLTKDMYTVEDVTGNGEWKTYKYVIKAECFKDEGMYEITVDSTDAAGNRQDNKLKKSPIGFVIDQTPPSVVITGVEDDAVYDQTSRKITFKVSDDQAVGELTIYVDGKEVAKYSAKQLIKMDGKVEYELKEAGKWQTVTAKVTDAAGNKGKEDSVRVLVTTNSLLRMFNNIAFRAGVGILGAALLGGLFVFFKKKKKKAPLSDETLGDGNDHSDNLSEPGNTADTTDGTAHTEETNK